VGSDNYKLIFMLDFISGVMAGIEFYFGENLEPEDKFAMTVDLLIFRVSVVYTKGNNYE